MRGLGQIDGVGGRFGQIRVVDLLSEVVGVCVVDQAEVVDAGGHLGFLGGDSGPGLGVGVPLDLERGGGSRVLAVEADP